LSRTSFWWHISLFITALAYSLVVARLFAGLFGIPHGVTAIIAAMMATVFGYALAIVTFATTIWLRGVIRWHQNRQ